MPDGKLFYIANAVPKNSDEPRRFTFRVVDPDKELFFANFFTDAARLEAASTIGELWRASCRPAMQPYKAGEAAWAFTSLSQAQCERLVRERFTGDAATRQTLLATCDAPGSH
jgi:hypothetical protein